jgi:transcriptional regulator with XRE-family HTH domain
MQERPTEASEHEVYALIGKKLRETRQNRMLTLEELSAMAALTPAFLGQIERGERKLSVAALEKVTRALRVTPNDLMLSSSRPSTVSWEARIASLLHNLPSERKSLVFKMMKVFLKGLRR